MLDARAEMVATQLRAGGITDPRVLAAMAEIPREEFLPAAVRERAYENGAIPIGHGQTISQPLVVATMTEALRLVGGEGVLEIGTGSGYQAAVLARLCRSVVTVELEPELAEAARATLARLGLENVKVVTGDGHLGWPPQAPYEAILVAAAPVELPPLLVGQLAAGGRLVAPVGPEGDQQLRAYTWAGRRLESRLIFPVRFVPLRRPPTTP